VYLNGPQPWTPGMDAETLFLDPGTGTGVFVRPAPGRVLLMDQDVLHRVSTPSQSAGKPRYSLVLKLCFYPKDGRGGSGGGIGGENIGGGGGGGSGSSGGGGGGGGGEGGGGGGGGEGVRGGVGEQSTGAGAGAAAAAAAAGVMRPTLARSEWGAPLNFGTAGGRSAPPALLGEVCYDDEEEYE
jgi:hypothetical protein